MDISWIIILLFSILQNVTANSYKNRQFEYGCIIDAGSSGSRIWIYAWRRRMTSSDIPSDMKELSNYKLKPGIAEYVNDEPGLRKHLRKLISKGTEYVPIPEQSSTPIYLMATAGTK